MGRLERRTMVRLPKSERTVENDVSNIRIRTPRGGFVPLEQIAKRSRGQAPTSITREDGIRSINVRADLAPGVPSSREVLTDIEQTLFPALKEKISRVRTSICRRTTRSTGDHGIVGSELFIGTVGDLWIASDTFLKVTSSLLSSCQPSHLDLWVQLPVI